MVAPEQIGSACASIYFYPQAGNNPAAVFSGNRGILTAVFYFNDLRRKQ